jgi:hypothetical protein
VAAPRSYIYRLDEADPYGDAVTIDTGGADMTADEHMARLDDLLAGTGEHEGHTREQVGRCVYCSCGQRIQGRAAAPPVRRWQVRLADGFVAYRGPEADAHTIADRHDGATVERSTT